MGSFKPVRMQSPENGREDNKKGSFVNVLKDLWNHCKISH
jgi:hypothetical protein